MAPKVGEEVSLYHSFPRCLARDASAVQQSPWQRERHDAAGIAILESMITHGLVLTTEPLAIPRNPRSASSIDFVHAQRRACFTLATGSSLFIGRERPGLPAVSHADLFGDFSIGIDPIDARQLGALPTIYFYRADPLATDSAKDDLDAEGGLSFQFFYRLVEIVELLKVVLRVEADSDWTSRMSASEIDAANLSLTNYPKILTSLESMSRAGSCAVLHKAIFDTDRVPAWNLIGAIRILLDLFQFADSKIRNTPLAYFQQREWRIPAVHRDLASASAHQDLYSLTKEPGSSLNAAVRGLSELVQKVNSPWVNPNGCWVRRGVNGRPFWSFVREVIVPAALKADVESLIRARSDHHPKVIGVGRA